MSTDSTTYESATNDDLTFFPRPAPGAGERPAGAGRAGSLLLLGGAVITLASLAGAPAPTGPPDVAAMPPTGMSATTVRGQLVCARPWRPHWSVPFSAAGADTDRPDPAASPVAPIKADDRPTVAELAARLHLHDPSYWTLDAGPPILPSLALPVRLDLDLGGAGPAEPGPRERVPAARGPEGAARVLPVAAIGCGLLLMMLLSVTSAGGASRTGTRPRASPAPPV